MERRSAVTPSRFPVTNTTGMAGKASCVQTVCRNLIAKEHSRDIK